MRLQQLENGKIEREGAVEHHHVKIRNRVVVTNKTPTGLNRGFGGPQVYFALERLVQRIAIGLGLDPLDVIKRNLIDAGAFPYRTATGALLDSGNYQEAIVRAVEHGRLAELKAKRDEARAQGRLYGIGFTAVVEPSVSNMMPTFVSLVSASPAQIPMSLAYFAVGVFVVYLIGAVVIPETKGNFR